MRNAENYIRKDKIKSNTNSLLDVFLTLFTVAAGACLGIGLIFLAAVWQGFVISQLWAWYIVPHFGLHHLPIVIAWGISLMASCLQSTIKNDYKPKYSSIVTPLMCLIFGWLGTWFM